MKCPACGFSNAAGMNFCGQCGASLASAEHAAIPKSSDSDAILSRFMTQGLSEKVHALVGKAEGERRQITVLFADMKGYTSLSEKLGEEAVYRLMDRIYECMINPVYREEGYVQQLSGDGMFAIFGAPVALEDAPLRACRTALAIQKKVQSLGDEFLTKHGFKPAVRIGIHTGPVVLGAVGTDLKMDFTAIGDTVNLASRLESAAEPGSILLSEATHRLVEVFVESEYTGEKRVKGKETPQKVFSIQGLKEEATRFDAALHHGLTPFIGRETEIDQLEHFCNEACSGTTLLVEVEGEAGIGKSRLIFEFQKRLEAKPVFLLKTHCTSFGKTTSFLPFLKVVRTFFGIEETDSRKEVESKIHEKLAVLGMDIKWPVPFLITFLGFEEEAGVFKGMDAKLIGDRTREILIEIIRKQCTLKPLVLVIEDLHWIDEASEELIHQAVRGSAGEPLLLLCAYRPEYRAPWQEHEAVREIRLHSLSRQGAVEMVGMILGIADVPNDVAEIVIGKSEGNPLFTEEVTRYLLESGNLEKVDREVTYQLVGERVDIPTGIVDLLQSRVDSLAEGPRNLLQTASVIGRRFSPELARRVAGLGEVFDRSLAELETQDFVVRDQEEYRFKHALIQDAIYDNLLQTRLEELHRAVGETIEELYPERLNEWAESLAFHWTNSSDAVKAVRYVVMAGKKSARVYALEEAHQRFRQAADLIDESPDCIEDAPFVDMLLVWAWVYVYRVDMEGLREMLEGYLSRVEAFGDKRHLSLSLCWLGMTHVFSGRRETGQPMLDRAKALGDETGDKQCIAHAAWNLAWAYSYWEPDCKISDRMVARYCDEAMALGKELDDILIVSNTQRVYAVSAVMRGRFREARRWAAEMHDTGDRLRDDRSFSMALWILGFCNILEDRYEEALACGEKSIEFSPDPHDEIIASLVKGGALALMGNVPEGLAIMTAARNELLKGAFVLPRAGVEMPFGAVTVLAGRMSEGVNHIKAMQKFFASLGNYVQQVWGHAFLGDIYFQMALGKETPPPVIMLKNLGFLLRTIPLAKRKARYHLGEVVRQGRACHMPGFLAKALYCLGVLSAMGKKDSEAREYFEEALQVAEANELFIADKVRSELEKTGKR